MPYARYRDSWLATAGTRGGVGPGYAAVAEGGGGGGGGEEKRRQKQQRQTEPMYNPVASFVPADVVGERRREAPAARLWPARSLY